ncbi:MAG TPA: M67 family metallopeptidase [Pyrinomonadaceae bacterium]|nr:M67 family metallopeptidase [Pyrinomonadaceae bacterium]
MSSRDVQPSDFKLPRALVEEMFAHAGAARPRECCGLLGGRGVEARSVYRLRNVAANPLASYEAAPEELFAAQREMRARGEELLGIYHSHPESAEPEPSEKDVRLAFYPSAVYFIVGFRGAGEGVLRAFRVSEAERRWERAEFRVVEG